MFRNRFIGAICKGHTLRNQSITLKRYAAGKHVLVSRHGLIRGVLDDALQLLGLEREIVTFVRGFSSALAFAGVPTLLQRCHLSATPRPHI
jgi:hypothetical protein